MDASRLEERLGIKLPSSYVKSLEKVANTCCDWPAEYVSLGDWMITDVDRLLALNEECRKKPSKFVNTPASLAKSWPRDYFVFSQTGALLCFFDTTETAPEIQVICDKKLQSPSDYRPATWRLDSFADLATSIQHQYRQIRKAVRQRDRESRMRERETQKTAPKAPCPDLVNEGWLLSRPALRLAASGNKYAAVWGGEGVVAPPFRGEWHHWLTVGCSHLPLNPRDLRGVISIYENTDSLEIKVLHDPRAKLPRQPDGEKLYGSRFDCLPSIGVVLSKGSAQVRRWLRGQGIWSGDAEGAWFDDQEPVDRYEAEFQSNHPHFLEDCAAMLGGWGIVYPDSNWRTLMNKWLLVTTFRDAEPWLEVYDSGKAFSCYSRIT